MTKAELISAVVSKTGLKRSQVERVVNGFIEAVAEALSNGERVALSDLGFFNIRERKARKGINPKTGKEITIPARKVVVFNPAKYLRETINK